MSGRHRQRSARARRGRTITTGLALVATGAVLVATLATPEPSPGPAGLALAGDEVTHTHASGMSMAPGSLMVMPDLGQGHDVVPAARAASLAARVDTRTRRSEAGSRSAARGTTVHHVTLALEATDDAEPDFTRAQALAGIALLRDFYRRQTAGALDITVDAVFDWERISTPCEDFGSVFDRAARRVDWTPGRDKHLVIMLPTTVQCDYAGIAGQGADVDSGENMISVGPSLDITSHELGHNLSLFHIGSFTCATGSDGTWDGRRWSNGCRTEEYGDSYDTMGAPRYNFDLSAPSLARLGALPSYYRAPARGTVSVRIAPVSGPATARRAVRLSDRSGNVYWIEARSTTGNDAFSPHPAAGDRDYRNGVRVIRVDPAQPGHFITLARPGDSSASAQSFRVGELVRLADGTRIRVVKLGSDGATVRITRPRS